MHIKMTTSWLTMCRSDAYGNQPAQGNHMTGNCASNWEHLYFLNDITYYYLWQTELVDI